MTNSQNAARFYHKADKRSRSFFIARITLPEESQFKEPGASNMRDNSTSIIVFHIRARLRAFDSGRLSCRQVIFEVASGDAGSQRLQVVVACSSVDKWYDH